MRIRKLLDRFYAIANGGKGDLSDIFSEDFELGIVRGFPYGGDYRGLAGVDEFFGAYKKHFDVWNVRTDRYLPVSEGEMVVTGSYSARTAESGVAFEMEIAHFWRARNGKLTSLKQYCDTAILSEAMGRDVPRRR